MAKFSGKKVSVAVGKETTRGTVSSSFDFIAKSSLSFQDKVEKIDDQSSIGITADAQDSEIIKTWSEGNIEAPLRINNISILLLALAGAVSTVDNADGTYTHTMTGELTSNEHQSITVGVADDIQDYTFANGMVNSMNIKIDPRDYIIVNTEIRALAGATAILTPSFSTDYTLLGKHATATINSLAVKIKNMDITIAKNLEDDDKIGSTAPADFNNVTYDVTGSIEMTLEAETYKNLDLDNTEEDLIITLENTAVNIGSLTTNPKLVITLPKVSFREWTPAYENNGIVKQTLAIKGLFDTTTSKLIEFELTNTKASI